MKALDKLLRKRPPYRLQFYWILSFLLISAVLATLFTVLLIKYRTDDLSASSDARLLMAAEMAREIVGADFHDNITGPSSISDEQFKQIVARNDDLCRRLHLQYLWSVLYVDGDLFFTTATHSDVNDPSSPVASFFEVHNDPESFSSALGTDMQPVFSSFNNEWGRGRQVLIPRKDEFGRTYIFGASIQTEEYDMLFRRTALDALLLAGVVLAGSFLLGLSLARRLTDPIHRLTESADRMASGDLEAVLPCGNSREVQSLVDSFERMRRKTQQYIQEIRAIEPRLALVLRASGVAIWDLDIANNRLLWDDTMFHLYGISRNNFNGTYSSWLERLHPEDQQRCQAEVELALLGEKEFNTEFRVLLPDGSTRYLRGLAQVERDVEGHPQRMTGTNWDITEMKLTELKVRQRHEELLAIFAGFDESVYVSDPETYELVYVNHNLKAQFGIPGDRKCYEYLQGRDNPCPFCTNDMIFGEHSESSYDWEYYNEANNHWYKCMDKAIHWPDGRSLRLEIAVDITDRKMAESELFDKLQQIERINFALNKSELKYRLLFENMTAGFALHEMIFDEDGKPMDYRYIEVNPAFEHLTGMKAEDLIGHTVREIMPNTEQYWIDTYGKVATTGEPVSYENYSQEIGRTFNVWAFSSGPNQFAVVFYDITDRVLAEKALRESEARNRMILDHSSDLIWNLTPQGVFTYASPSWKMVTGYTVDEITGKSFQLIVHEEDNPVCMEYLAGLIMTKQPAQSPEYRVRHADGNWYWHQAVGNPVLGDDGEVISVIGVSRDITARKHAEEMLAKMNTLLLAKNKELEQLVYVASHDLRSPLVNIDGYSRELGFTIDEFENELMKSILPAELTKTVSVSLQEIRSDLHYILSSTTQMDGLLSGLLKLSRSGRTALNITVLDVDMLVTQVLAAIEFQILESGVSIERMALPSCQGDAVTVSQVFTNLINNALKFRHPTRPGVIRISGSVEGDQAVYCVEDNGIGISLAHQEKIFNLFQRLDPDTYPGEGLGLTIVRQSLYRLGGSVWVESEPGCGSRFYFSLPGDEKGIYET